MVTPEERWDAKYTGGPGSIEPAAMLDEIADVFPPGGSVVDVAGGSGRNALWFARRGHPTTVIDVSRVGLALAARAAETEGLQLETVKHDLETDGMPADRTWDIAFMHLFVDRSVLRALPRSLNPGGVLVFAQPTTANLERHEKPRAAFLLQPGEVTAIADALEDVDIVRADEGWPTSGRHEGWLIARKR